MRCIVFDLVSQTGLVRQLLYLPIQSGVELEGYFTHVEATQGGGGRKFSSPSATTSMKSA